jgi:hypothetical protein
MTQDHTTISNSRFWKMTPWLIRISLLPPTVILALIGHRYIANPVGSAAAQGILLPPGLGVTIARVGLGGFPLACSIFVATCLFSTRRLLTGLSFVGILMTVILTVRIFGMRADSTVRENVKLVRAEIGLVLLTSAAFLVELKRRARTTAE